MIQQITKGIKISVETNYQGLLSRNGDKQHAFSYSITIENKSNDSIQLLSRHWRIFDALNFNQIVTGEGVVGKKPILKPNESFTYVSNCFLTSPFGAMRGFFNMVNFSTTKIFKVYIPTFQLMNSYTLN